jgi:hypothetical protein
MTALPNGVVIESADITRAQTIFLEIGLLVAPGAVCRMGGGGGGGGPDSEYFQCARLTRIWRITPNMARKHILLEGWGEATGPMMNISLANYSEEDIQIVYIYLANLLLLK